MAGRDTIQFLRGTEAAFNTNADRILLDGQPMYDKTNNWLYIGNGNTIANRTTLSVDFSLDALTTTEVESIWNTADNGDS